MSKMPEQHDFHIWVFDEKGGGWKIEFIEPPFVGLLRSTPNGGLVAHVTIDVRNYVKQLENSCDE